MSKQRVLRSGSTKTSDMSVASACPEGVIPQLWDMMVSQTNKLDSIKEDTEQTRNRVEQLENKFTTLEKSGSDNQSDIKQLQDTVKLLSAQLERSGIEQRSLRHTLQDLQSQSMKDNLIFNFDQKSSPCREIKGENCTSVIKIFLGEYMHVPDSGRLCIPVAHRLGPFKRGVTRPIIAKFPFAD